MGEHPLLRSLRGGDRRSIGQADAAARAAIADPACAEVLWQGLLAATDPVVRMRCADALEKFSQRQPDFIDAHRADLLQLAQAPQPKELRWHLMQMLPRAAWAPREHAAVLAAIRAALHDASAIVQVNALQALHELAPRGEPFARAAAESLDEALQSPQASVRARAARLAASGRG
ncbi:hypothetical protein [Ottowia sp.]|uniref:hypothetical protein n=1 Tax=Ottowia sp. TaxID=1898956 RepID=UPI002CC0F0F1|nr:hypothetical protein [Ottowia sp.]HRN77075.1 hypothetical protein [Ottowia sp.]HRQ04121.1 hypothetical protein [Ottowia sp.]